MENEALVPKPTSLWSRHKEKLKIILLVVLVVIIFSGVTALKAMGEYEEQKEKENYVPNITIPSMDLTVLNITETRLSVKWDLLIRIPPNLPGYYTCLKGDFQVFILYEGVTITTSSIESYNLIPRWPQLLNVSWIASEGHMDGAIVKDIKERVEMRFGSRLLLPDCRYGTRGKMNYLCDEAILGFDSSSQRKATLFGNNPICHYLH